MPRPVYSLMSAFATLAALAVVGITACSHTLPISAGTSSGFAWRSARARDSAGIDPVAFGLAGGVIGAWMLTRLLGTLLYHVSPTSLDFRHGRRGFDGGRLLAMLIPASRAMRID